MEEYVFSSIMKHGHHPFSRCGFSQTVEIVCCPKRRFVTPKPTVKPNPTPTSAKFGMETILMSTSCHGLLRITKLLNILMLV